VDGIEGDVDFGLRIDLYRVATVATSPILPHHSTLGALHVPPHLMFLQHIFEEAGLVYDVQGVVLRVKDDILIFSRLCSVMGTRSMALYVITPGFLV
jgi:hypothetical protein